MIKQLTRVGKAGTESPTPRGLCIHVQRGIGSMAKFCIHGFECRHCAYDQWIDAMEAEAKAGSGLKWDGGMVAKAA